MTENQSVVCPKCQTLFINDQKENSRITIDYMGEAIRADALSNLQENRAKCPNCKTDFCLKCKSIPYHESFTCEEQKLVDKNIICRYCNKYPAIGCENQDHCHRVCWHQECQENISQSCMHICTCGHSCCGLRDESTHFGCAKCNSNISKCSICQESCTTSPSVIMRCGHPAHKSCLEGIYKSLDEKGRIRFPRCNHQFTCNQIPYHECVKNLAQKWLNLNNKVEEMIIEKMKMENTENEKMHVCNPNCKSYYKQPLKFARDFFIFYICDECKEPYYAGHKDCNDAENDDSIVHKCLNCNKNILNAICPKHGENGMVIKCMFCCRPATFRCYGNNTYFCDKCHQNPSESQKGPFPTCNGKCIFNHHAPNGQKSIVGYCSICEAEKEKSLLNSNA